GRRCRPRDPAASEPRLHPELLPRRGHPSRRGRHRLRSICLRPGDEVVPARSVRRLDPPLVPGRPYGRSRREPGRRRREFSFLTPVRHTRPLRSVRSGRKAHGPSHTQEKTRMKLKHVVAALAALLAPVAGAVVSPRAALAGSVTVKGSDTMVVLGQRWAEEYMKAH